MTLPVPFMHCVRQGRTFTHWQTSWASSGKKPAQHVHSVWLWVSRKCQPSSCWRWKPHIANSTLTLCDSFPLSGNMFGGSHFLSAPSVTSKSRLWCRERARFLSPFILHRPLRWQCHLSHNTPSHRCTTASGGLIKINGGAYEGSHAEWADTHTFLCKLVRGDNRWGESMQNKVIWYECNPAQQRCGYEAIILMPAFPSVTNQTLPFHLPTRISVCSHRGTRSRLVNYCTVFVYQSLFWEVAWKWLSDWDFLQRCDVLPRLHCLWWCLQVLLL